jgi:DNA polymerase-1
MKNKQDKDLELQIAKSVIKEISDEKLIAARNFFTCLSDHKRVTKLYNTYIVGVEQSLANTGNGMIYCVYNLDGAVTGRLSNSGATKKKGKGPDTKIGVSFHTLPREQEDFNIRNYITAPDGWDFITADMKAMELRVLADVANEQNMIKAFNDGIDLHTYSASMTFNKDPKDITKEERQIAKEVSFLTVYGGKAFTLANKRNIPEAQAEEIINSWMAAFPGVKRYMATIEDYVKQFKYAKTIFGRYRHLPNIDSPNRRIREEAFRQGLNFTIQSPASDILLCCLIGVSNKMNATGLRARITATVHDSICIVSPKNETSKVIDILRDEMRNYTYMRENFHIKLKVPLDIDIKVGTSFGNGKELKFTA